MSKKALSILILFIFLVSVGCSPYAMKYNKSRNGGKRINANGNMRR